MRVALHSVVRDGHEAGYEAAHATIPEDLAASFARVGIRDWMFWRWQAFIGRFVDHFETTGEGPQGMIVGEVWSLAGQRDARARPTA